MSKVFDFTQKADNPELTENVRKILLSLVSRKRVGFDIYHHRFNNYAELDEAKRQLDEKNIIYRTIEHDLYIGETVQDIEGYWDSL